MVLKAFGPGDYFLWEEDTLFMPFPIQFNTEDFIFVLFSLN